MESVVEDAVDFASLVDRRPPSHGMSLTNSGSRPEADASVDGGCASQRVGRSCIGRGRLFAVYDLARPNTDAQSLPTKRPEYQVVFPLGLPFCIVGPSGNKWGPATDGMCCSSFGPPMGGMDSDGEKDKTRHGFLRATFRAGVPLYGSPRGLTVGVRETLC